MFSGGADWSNIVQYDGLFVLYSLKPRLYIPDFVGYFFKAVRQNPEQKSSRIRLHLLKQTAECAG